MTDARRDKQIVWHTSNRSKWDVDYIKKRLSKLHNIREHELQHPKPAQNKLRGLEDNIIYLMQRLNMLDQAYRSGIEHKFIFRRDAKFINNLRQERGH